MNDDVRHSDGAFWSVTRTHPHKESVALQALEAQGYAVFCPWTWKTVRRSRKLHNRRAPLFPGYVFISFGRDVWQWRPVRSTRGVQYLLTGKDGWPNRLPAGFIENLQAQTSDEGTFSFRESLSPGQRVRVTTGAFADFVGEVEALDEQGRVRLLLGLMSRQVRVTLPGKFLQDVA